MALATIPRMAGVSALILSSLALAGCFGAAHPPGAAAPADTRPVGLHSLEWSSNATMGAAALRLDLLDVSASQRCNVTIAVGGLMLPGNDVQGVALRYEGGSLAGMGGGSGGGLGAQFGSTRLPTWGSSQASDALGPAPEITESFSVSKKEFAELDLTGDFGFGVALPDVRPTDRDDGSYFPMGNRSAWVDLECNEAIEAHLYASREVWLATAGNFDTATHVNTLFSSVEYGAESRRGFASSAVDVGGYALASHLPNPLQSELTISHPKGTDRWDMSTGRHHFFSGDAGSYTFHLERVATMNAPIVGGACSGLACPSGPHMVLAAIGWVQVPNLEGFAELPGFAS